MNKAGYLKRSVALIFGLSSLTGFSQDQKQKLREDIVAMANIGYCRSGQYLSDGKDIVFISNMSGSPQIWRMPVTGGWPVQLTAFSDPVTAMAASPKGDLVAFQLAPGGGLNTQIYIMKDDGSNVTLITKGGRTNNFLDKWSEDGKYIGFGSNEQNETGIDFFIYDVQKHGYDLLMKNNGQGGISDFSNDNKKVLVSKLASRGSDDLYLYDLSTRQEKPLTKHEGPGTFFGDIAPSGEIFLGTNRDRDLIAFGRMRNDSIKILSERKDAELSDLSINHDGTFAVLTWNEGGRSRVSLFDIKSGKELKKLSLPVELVSGVSFSPDNQSLIFTGSGAKEPVNIWTYAIKYNRFTKLTESPHAGVDLSSLVTPELVKFKSFDSLEISGWLYRPKNAPAPFPTVISYHGGPEGQSVPGLNVTAQLLLKQGIAFFLPNVRGSSGFGKKFVNLDNGALRVNSVRDIKAVSDYLVNSGISKKDALGIMGGSYGGYMVMAGVTEYPNMFAAGANLFGVVNFETFFKNTEPWMAAISTIEYGDPATQSLMLSKLSPIHKADLIKTPLLVEHGANDTNVPVVEAEQVVAALKKNKVPVQYTLFPDEGHGWQKTKNRIASTMEIVEWFVDRLK